MAAIFVKLHRHRIEKQKLIINLINSSDCWTGINDLRPKYGTLSPRNHLKQKEIIMKLTIIGNPDEISKLIQLFTERDDETEEIEETDEIGFLAEKKPDGNRTSQLN